MKERKMEDLMIDFVEGNLNGELRAHVEKTIEKDEKWKLEFERLTKVVDLMASSPDFKPDSKLKSDFENMLANEIEKENPQGQQIQMSTSHESKWYLKVAASIAFVAVGIIIGVLVMKNQQNQEELLALKREMEQTKQFVIASLQNQASASGRLNAVNTSMDLTSRDNEILSALINAMNTDENTNVRLAAIDALARSSSEEQVRSALIAALETQDDPVVMIHLINLMVTIKEQGAVESFKNLLERENLNSTVKEEVHLGLLELS